MLSSDSTKKAKKALRRQILPRRRSLPAPAVAEKSQEVCHRVLGLADFSAAILIAAYMAIKGEVDLAEIINHSKRAGKKLILPRYNAVTKNYEMIAVENPEDDLVQGHYGILEPKAKLASVSDDTTCSQQLVWLVPGVAFDRNGNRLGRGGGWYDKMLGKKSGTNIGICWDWQICSQVPVNTTDVQMDVIVTDSRTIRCQA